MPLKTAIGDRTYYFLPQRVTLAFAIIEVIAKQDSPTTTTIMDETNFSRAYVSACLTALKRHDIIHSTRGATGGYSLVKDVQDTTVGEILEAISKDEDRSIYLETLHRLMIGKLKDLTVKDLIEG